MKPSFLRKQIADAKIGTTLYILGATGIGKTHAMKEVCQHAFWIDSTKCANVKEFCDMVEKQLHTSLLQKFASTTESSKKIIVIDEYEVLYQLDRGILGYVSEIIQNTHVIVVISNIAMEKKINQSSPNANIIYFSAMSESDICILLRNRFPTHSYADILNAAENCYGNVTQAVNMISLDQKQNETDILSQSLTIEDVFKPQPRANIIKIIEDDPWLIPLRYHENIHKFISSKAAYKRVIEGMCVWDILMQLSGGISVYPIEYFAGIVLTTYQFCKKNTTGNDCSGFTKLLSHLSLQKKNEKLMYSYDDQDFPWDHSQIFCDYIKYR